MFAVVAGIVAAALAVVFTVQGQWTNALLCSLGVGLALMIFLLDWIREILEQIRDNLKLR